MQPCSREMMQSLNSLLLQDLQMSSSDDFLEQILASSSSSAAAATMWDPNAAPSLAADAAAFAYDEHSTLASKFRNHQITSKLIPWHHHHHHLPDPSSLLQIPLSLPPNDAVDAPSFKSGGETSVQALYNGFTGSLPPSNHAQHFQPPQAVASAAATTQAPAQPRQRVRARRGQATDPHSIAERLRRERIAERMKALQELVPNANKTDKASMLDEIIDYVKFLQLQVKVLSMSRLGGAAAVAPLVADISSQGGGDCIQANANNNNNNNQTTPASTSNDSMSMTEKQVAKLMEEDMGSAMQYLQGKGLCLMPISLATAISTATCHTRNPFINNNVNAPPAAAAAVTSNCDGPSSPNMSVLTVQSAVAPNESAVKDAASVSKPSG